MEEEKEVKEEEKEIPSGYYLAEVPTNFQRYIAIGDKTIDSDELLVKIANACEKAGLLK